MMKFKKEGVFIPKIKVVGVGGGGCNVINSMIRAGGLENIELCAVNTDLQHLEKSLAKEKIQIGKELSRGLGAGADPEIGRRAAIENLDEIREAIEGTDILFLLGGFGGGTGTGALPVIAEAAKEMNILTIAVVSKPFAFEGKNRIEKADRGLAALRKVLDTIICISNDRLFEIVGENTSLVDAFAVIDNILYEGVRAIFSLMSSTGYINVDFADMRTIMCEKGRAILSFGEGSGKGKAANAIDAALTSPFIEWHDISGAKGILINFTGGRDLTLFEINDAVKALKKVSSPDANVIFGAMIDESMQDRTYVTILITGLPNDMFEAQGINTQASVEEPLPARAPQPQQSQQEHPAVKHHHHGPAAAAAGEEAKAGHKLEQSVIEFQNEDLGIFDHITPTIYDGENLDVPAWMRAKEMLHSRN